MSLFFIFLLGLEYAEMVSDALDESKRVFISCREKSVWLPTLQK